MQIDNAVAIVDAIERGELDTLFQTFACLRHTGPVMIEPGWSGLAFRLLLGLDAIAARHGGQVAVAEIKNKLGSMRIWADFIGDKPDAYDDISEFSVNVEIESARRCRICGAFSEVNSRDYCRHSTLCGAHWRVTLPQPGFVSAHGRLAARALPVAAGD